MVMIMGKNPLKDDPTSVAIGSRLFLKNCVQCHGKDGRGGGELAKSLPTSPANLPQLAQGKSAKTFAANIYYGKNAMPAYKNQFSEEQIWHLANFVKSMGERANPLRSQKP